MPPRIENLSNVLGDGRGAVLSVTDRRASMPSGAEIAAAAARTAQKDNPRPPSIVGGVLSSIFTKGTAMQRYSKLIAAVLGNLLGVLVVWLATKGFATCTDFSMADTCTVFGFTTAQLNAGVMILINGIFVYAAPKNVPPS